MVRALSVMAVVAAASVARGDTRSVFFSDPIGDHTGMVDVSSLTFSFDGTTGAYEILLAAHATSPFAGSFRVNVNLFNPDTGTTLQDPSFFSDTLNVFNLTAPQS